MGLGNDDFFDKIVTALKQSGKYQEHSTYIDQHRKKELPKINFSFSVRQENE